MSLIDKELHKHICEQKHKNCILMESSLQRENSKALQCMEKSWFGRNFSYNWEYQQHIGANSQKMELILYKSFNEDIIHLQRNQDA